MHTHTHKKAAAADSLPPAELLPELLQDEAA